MTKKTITVIVSAVLAVSLIFTAAAPVFAQSGSSQVAGADEMAKPQKVGKEEMEPISGEQVADGQYEIEVDSSSSMFRIVRAVLSVKNGDMSAVLTLSGKGYGKLFMGTGEEAAAAEESEYIPYVEDENGSYTYEVPVEVLDKAVKCAAWSIKKEKWYDRDLVFLSDNIPEDRITGEKKGSKDDSSDGNNGDSVIADLSDGQYFIDVTFAGGSGRATIESPAELTVKDGKATAKIQWSSPHYDYMIVDGTRYEPVNSEGNSVFEIPVRIFDEKFTIIGNTTAMGSPHEIEYQLSFDSRSIVSADESGNGEEKQDSGISWGIIAGIAVLVLIGLIAGIVIGRRIAAKKRLK